MENLIKKLDKKMIITVLVVILVLQVIARIYLGTRKEYFHMDEMYSYGLMNYNKIDIDKNEDFYNNWHEKQYYKDYIEITKDEVWDFGPVYENQKNDVHPPFYYLLLRIASTFSVDNFTKWTGIILNIVLFILSSILVYLVANKLLDNKILALLACIVNGFTFMSLESSLYIRMYELGNLNIMFLTYTQLRILDKKELKFTNLIPIIISLVLGGLTHYYFFIYAVVIYIMYTVKCIRQKQYKNLVKYNVAMVVAAGIFLVIFPHAINHIFFSYRGLSAGNETGYFLKIAMFLEIIVRNISGYFIILVPFIIYILTRKKEKNMEETKESLIDWLIIPMISYFLLVTKNAPYIELRYMIPLYSVITISIIYFIWKGISKYYKTKQALKVLAILCIFIIITPFIIGMKFDFTYEKFHNIASVIEQKQLPIVYILNRDCNRFLDDLYLFTLVDKSIVIDSKELYRFEEEIEELDRYILICNDDKIQEEFLKNKNGTYLEHMNACHVWEINK